MKVESSNIIAVAPTTVINNIAKELEIEIKAQNEHGTMLDFIGEKCAQQIDGDAFCVINVKTLIDRYELWKEKMPRVHPFYAIKCNPDSTIIKILASFGVNFDCASLGEIKQVLSLGVEPERIIFANPTKQPSHIRFAAENGVEMLTFDNANELRKIKENHPHAKAVLRILTDDSRSICRFGAKFGANPKIARTLLEFGKELGVNIIGVSFHVGSGCYDATAFTDAVAVARDVFDQAEDLGLNFSLLDIGGGFPGSDSDIVSFDDIAQGMSTKLAQLFPENVRVIAEPGRFFVTTCATVVCSVIARRDISQLEQDDQDIDEALDVIEAQSLEYLYYINDGVYGSFNNIMFDHAVPHPTPLDPKYKNSRKFKSTVFGPTCDSIDCVSKNEFLPLLEIGDWVYVKKMGAYTNAAASNFNGFQRPKQHYVYFA